MKANCIILSLIGCAVASMPAIADKLECPCKVVKIVDGDTIHVIDKNKTREKIRLAGIDAPEEKQAFGQKSKEYLSSMIASKTVDIDYSKKDRYGRIIGKILKGHQDINLKMVKAGLAWHYKKYQREQNLADREAYSEAESWSRTERVGLWKDEAPVAPWVHRRSN